MVGVAAADPCHGSAVVRSFGIVIVTMETLSGVSPTSTASSQGAEVPVDVLFDKLGKHIEHRKAQDEFLARGLASAAEAERTGEYVAAASVLRKLEAKLRRAKSKRG